MKTANEIALLGDKTIIDAYQATVVECKRSNTTAKGPITTYSTRDASGGMIDVSIAGPQYTTIAPNSLLTVSSTANGKGGIGGVVVNQYNGKNSITCWDNASVQVGGADAFPGDNSQPAQTQAPAQGHPQPQQPQQFSTSMSIDEMADIWVKARQAYRQKLEAAGVQGDALDRAADTAPQLVALFWFGKDKNKLANL